MRAKIHRAGKGFLAVVVLLGMASLTTNLNAQTITTTPVGFIV